MKNKLKYTGWAILILITGTVSQVFAQTVTPEASGQNSIASADETKKARASVEANPDSLEAHSAYIKAMGIKNPLLTTQYKVWMEKYPKKATIPLVIGTAYYNAEMPQAKGFLLKAAAMESKNANIWFMLSMDADRWGQSDLSTEYMRKATLVDPSDAGYAYYYLITFEESDPDGYKQRVFDFVKRFPASERGAQALFWLGQNRTNLNDRIKYFEDLHKLYPPKKFKWSAAGMIRLADAYLQIDVEKALILINEMGEEKDWKTRKQIAESLIEINKLEQDKDYKEALVKVEQVKLPEPNFIKDFLALKKTSLRGKAGDLKAAYDSLAVKFAKLPTDKLDTALEFYGKKIGKDKSQIAKDIDTIRKSTAVAAFPFELGLYTTNGKLSLKDLKGKVVLLTFWFPGCGPCNGEFPHFQAVINKFKGENVVYVGINVTPSQDSYVLPFMQNTKYSFIPLRGSAAFASQNYGVNGEPENFLIDKEGKIVFKDFRIDNSNHRTLELMISSLLKENKQQNP